MIIGFDYHGVLDVKGNALTLLTMLMHTCEVYIITGMRWKTFNKKCDDKWLIRMINKGNIKFRSISDWRLEFDKESIDITNPNKPKIHDKNKWNVTKALICLEEGIDIFIDNDPEYGKHIKELCPNTEFLLYIDKNLDKLLRE